MPPLNEISDRDLLLLVDRIDREEFSNGVDIKGRGFSVVKRVIEECGEVFSLGVRRSPGLDRVEAAYKAFYRMQDIGVGAVNAGLAVHLDIFFRVHLPVVFGRITANPFDWTDMTDMQKARLHSESAEEREVLCQIIDVIDIGSTLGNFAGFNSPPPVAAPFFSMAAFHNQAAASICTSAFDLRGAIMASLLCAELATKSLALASGLPHDELQRAIGHNLQKARPYLEKFEGFDVAEFLTLAERLPHFVNSRYEEKDWSRGQCAEIVLAGQKMLAMAARHFAGHSFANSVIEER